MFATPLKPLAFLAAFGAAGTAVATDSSDPNALSRWEADRTIFLEAADVEIDAFQWVARPVVVFADSPNDPAFQRQIELLQARTDELVERDVVVIVDTDKSNASELRRELRPRGFMLTLIGKDGGVKLRKPFPWDVRELTRQIDKMPIRLQEIQDAKAAAAAGAE